MSQSLFITDFDGVLCDSVQECALITYNAYNKLLSSSYQRILSLEEIELSKREQFRKLRPYIRGAEDFVPIFVAIENNIRIANQKDFDTLRAEHEKDLLKYQEAFYAERDFLLQHEKELWLSLNLFFEGIEDALKQCTSFDQIYILTTKRQADVLEIFQYQGIPFPAEHVAYVKAAGKLGKLLDILQENDAVIDESAYIEDQVDFLVESKKHNIGSYLVEWGYVSEEQKTLAQQHEIPIITLRKFKEILRSF
jgi:phosphoglycolate phosphatase-like HAD superfamily hydrolase